MRIVVLGSAGMLGHKMVERLRLRFEDVYGLSREDGLNAEDMSGMSTFWMLEPLRPEVVINCVGIIKQRAQDLTQSIAVNTIFPQTLHQSCLNLGAHLIHFSTDCVFSGKRGQYAETDLPDPEDIYGRTKVLGEVQSAGALTLRTSIVGREKSNYNGLLEWFLRQSGEIRGYENVYWSGVTTNWLSDTVAELINREPLSGLYQIASSPVNKFHLLEMFKNVYQKEIRIARVSEPICDRSLRGDKFRQTTGIETPQLSEMLAAQREQDRGTLYAI